jgi:AcrR family transcriptional regulator
MPSRQQQHHGYTADVTRLRERYVEQTRSAILDAAFELFAEKGFAATTIDEIVARADVGKRTFFRHFAAKEALAFHDAADQLATATADLLARLEDEEPYPALVAVLRTTAERLTTERGRWLAGLVAERDAIIEHHKGVVMRDFEEAVTTAIAAHTGTTSTDVRVRAGVGAVMGAFAAAVETWLLAGATNPFVPLFEDALAAAADALAATRPMPRPQRRGA